MTSPTSPDNRSLNNLKLTQAINYHQRGQLKEAEELYNSILVTEPQHADVHHMLGLMAFQRGQFPEAKSLIERAIAIAPSAAPYYSNLGATLRELKEPALALKAFEKAIALKPDYAEAYNNQGNALRALGRRDEAFKSYERATRLRSNYAEAWLNWALTLIDTGRHADAYPKLESAVKANATHWRAWMTLGDLKRQQGDFQAALTQYEQAVAINPVAIEPRLRQAETLLSVGRDHDAFAACESCLADQPDNTQALHLRGFLQQKSGHLDLAIADYDLALLFDPALAPAYLHRALARASLGQIDIALEDFDQAVALQPNNADAHCHRGVALTKLGRLDEAAQAFDEAIRINPRHAVALVQRASARVKSGAMKEALSDYQTAINIDPSNADFYFNQGFALQEADQLDAALESYQTAVRLNPDNTAAQNNLAALLQTLDRLDEAFSHFDHAIKLGHTEARWNKGVALLLKGDYAEGWPLFEARWEVDLGLVHTPFIEPRWTGREDLNGKTILLHPEQGFGDTIQFCRYASLVADLGANVILEVPQRLVELANTLRGPKIVIACGDERPAFDYQCPLMSLPLAFQTTLTRVPAHVPYLSATAERIATWQQRLGPKRRKRVGIVWRGSPHNKNDRYRSMRLQELTPIFEADFEFYSIQKDVTADEQAILASFGVHDLSADQRDFADAAAICHHMDLIVTVDTAVAHLSGAMGLPTWILICHAPDWRWMLHRTDCPWYPTAKLYRQLALNQWASPVNQILNDLKQI